MKRTRVLFCCKCVLPWQKGLLRWVIGSALAILDVSTVPWLLPLFIGCWIIICSSLQLLRWIEVAVYSHNLELLLVNAREEMMGKRLHL